MKLDVGEFYLSASGEIVKIDNRRENDIFPFLSTNGTFYMQDGSYFEDEEDKQDLIAHIPKELHWSLVNQVYSYYKNINARNKIVRRHKNFFNKKKTTIPD